VIVVVAVDSRVHQFSGKEGSNGFVSIAFCSGADLDARLSESVLGALAHSAADESVDAGLLEKPREGLVPYAV
jgi:hypothetical protein